MTTTPTDQSVNISFNRGRADGRSSRLMKNPIHTNWRGKHPDADYERGYWEGFSEGDPQKMEPAVIQKIAECKQLPTSPGMVPSVFRARQLDGTLHIGCNYQPEGTTVGDRFHYDHGAGIQRNQDAEVIWLKPAADARR